MRKQSGMTLSKLAEGLGWSISRLANIEAGRRGTHLIDMVRLVGYCQADQAALDRVVDIAKEAETGYLIRPHVDGIPDGLRALRVNERKAAEIIDYQTMVVPGLLQTPEYARAVMLGSGDPLEAVEPGVATRMERQEVLRGPRPTQGTFFVHESALHSWVGGWQIMADQMLQLALWSAWKHLSIRLVPFAVGSSLWTSQSFKLLEFKDSAPVVHTSNLVFSVLSERAEVVKKHQDGVEYFDRVALSAQESRSEFARWADHYERLRGQDDPGGATLA